MMDRGGVVENIGRAQEIVDELNGATRKRVLSLLAEHVKQSHRKNPVAKKDLVGWLMKPNKIRNFWFYKATGLKDLAKLKGLDLGKGRKTIDQLREILANPSEHCRGPGEESQRKNGKMKLPPREAATQAILEKSFLPHQKGKAREHCSLGHRLELPILRNWINVVSGEDSPCEGFKIKSAYTAGLAAKKGAEYAKDSIDFIVLAEQDENNNLEAWGFEAKGRVTSRSAAEEERNLRYYNNPHISISSNQVFDEVASEGERFQVLQHAFVYDLEKVVLAISDSQSTLIWSVKISFDDKLKEDFGKVLQDIKGFSLDWAYPTEDVRYLTVPKEILDISSGISTINRAQTIQGTANIWHSLVKLAKPFPSFLRHIPAVYAFWNSVKGGSDTTTKLMDDCILRIPKLYLNPEAAAVGRILSLLFVLIHRLHQVFSGQDHTNFTCLLSYRKAASARATYHISLLQCAKLFNETLKKNATEEPPTFLTPALVRRSNRNRQIDGAVPEAAQFGARLQEKTPRKIGQMAANGKLSSGLKEMVSRCEGEPLKTYPLTYGKCAKCHAKTAWFCTGCKRWLCLDRRALQDSKKDLQLYHHIVRGKEKTFLKMCFHEAHERNWRKRHYSVYREQADETSTHTSNNN